MENSRWNLNVYSRERCSCFRIKQSSRLKYNGSALVSMKLHGIWWIRCGLCIFHCFPVEEKKFWYDVWYMFLVHVLVMF